LKNDLDASNSEQPSQMATRFGRGNARDFDLGLWDRGSASQRLPSDSLQTGIELRHTQRQAQRNSNHDV
jgi:hypothetical protein